MSSSLDPKKQDDDDDGEWQEMPVLRSAQMPKSAFHDLDDDELKKYKYRPPSPTHLPPPPVTENKRSSRSFFGSSSKSGSASAGNRNKPTASRTGNATGRILDIDDARGYNWRSKPEHMGGGHDDDGHGDRKSEGSRSGSEDEDDGGVKGYTQLRIDEDEEAEQIHAATEYLFGGGANASGGTDKNPEGAEADMDAQGYDQDLSSTNPLSQLATTKQLLTEQQKIAYVGLCSLAMRDMVRQLERIPGKEPGVVAARQSAEEWRVSVMGRLYKHMDIDTSEQVMIDSLAHHGVLIEDLAPALIMTHKVRNPDYDPEAARQKAEDDSDDADKGKENDGEENSTVAKPSSAEPSIIKADGNKDTDKSRAPTTAAETTADAAKAEGEPDVTPTTAPPAPAPAPLTSSSAESAKEEAEAPLAAPTTSPLDKPRDSDELSFKDADLGDGDIGGGDVGDTNVGDGGVGGGDIGDGDLGDGDIGGGDVGDRDIGDGDLGDGDGDIGASSVTSPAATSRHSRQRSSVASSSAAKLALDNEKLKEAEEDSGDLASTTALAAPPTSEPSNVGDEDITAATNAEDGARTPKAPRSDSIDDIVPASARDSDKPEPEPPEDETKAPILVDPNTAGQIDAQLSTVRPSLGPSLGLTSEPIPIEPPPAALEGVTTSLSTSDKDITLDIRWTVLCDLFLVLMADSIYDARSRVLLERVAEALSLTWMDVTQFEKRITDALEIEEGVDKLRNKKVIAEREKLARKKRYVMMGLATVGGGLVIGLSAGLLAPVIGAGLGAALGAVGIGGTGTFLGGVGGAAIITTTGTLGGAGIAGKGMSRRTRSVKTFTFKAIHNNKRVSCIVGMPGFTSGAQDDVRLPFSVIDSIMGDVFSVLWEPEMMQEMGNSLSILWNETLTQGVQQLLALTVAGGLVGALAWPLWLLKLGYLIDNPWSNALDRAKAAGLILADVLAKRQIGVRPITLVGFSLGARAIFYALVELARIKAFGVVQNVYIMGTPVTAADRVWKEARSVVAGRFVNVFSRSDWILGYLYRATSGGLRSIAGLHPVEVMPDIENVDVTHVIPGHLAYRALMPLVLSELQFRTTADYFDEPVDVDKIPIRQVVNEEEEQPVEEEKSGGFTKLFRRSDSKGAGEKTPDKGSMSRNASSSSVPAPVEKQLPSTRPPIEEYDEDLPERMEHPIESVQPPQSAPLPPTVQPPPYRDSHETVVTPARMSLPSPHFDADAILAELRESGIQVRELESSLPPLVASSSSVNNPPTSARRSTLTVHNPPSPVHDRSRSNSFTAAPSPSPSLLSPPSPAGLSSFSGGGGGASPTIATMTMAMDQHHAAAGGLPSPVPKSTGSMSFNQQEDLGTARDRGLSRQLPSLSSTSMLSPGHEMGQGSGSGGLNMSFGGSGSGMKSAEPSAPAVPRKSSMSSNFAPYDHSGWGASSASVGLNGGMPMVPPQEPALTFGGEDGELSFNDNPPRPPAAAPWNSDNPWG
ncbi:hypothetical protein CF327_g4294 [Tilletia walkeri]|nr:hypothetical protein CF327_g4294 [Tilletia walkeri]